MNGHVKDALDSGAELQDGLALSRVTLTYVQAIGLAFIVQRLLSLHIDNVHIAAPYF